VVGQREDEHISVLDLLEDRLPPRVTAVQLVVQPHRLAGPPKVGGKRLDGILILVRVTDEDTHDPLLWPIG
jgi:hypothetical protein